MTILFWKFWGWHKVSKLLYFFRSFISKTILLKIGWFRVIKVRLKVVPILFFPPFLFLMETSYSLKINKNLSLNLGSLFVFFYTSKVTLNFQLALLSFFGFLPFFCKLYFLKICSIVHYFVMSMKTTKVLQDFLSKTKARQA